MREALGPAGFVVPYPCLCVYNQRFGKVLPYVNTTSVGRFLRPFLRLPPGFDIVLRKR